MKIKRHLESSNLVGDGQDVDIIGLTESEKIGIQHPIMILSLTQITNEVGKLLLLFQKEVAQVVKDEKLSPKVRSL